MDLSIEERAARHAALGDPTRLAIVDALVASDLAPIELQERFGIASNLLSHHLAVLENAGLVARSRSSGDGRRRYVRLTPTALDSLRFAPPFEPGSILFVCTANSARSQLAAVLWRHLAGTPAESAGTHPAPNVSAGAVAAAKRAGLDLADARPRALSELRVQPTHVVTVCDRAHEELEPASSWLHWSISDPVPVGTRAAYDATLAELRSRMLPLVAAAGSPS